MDALSEAFIEFYTIRRRKEHAWFEGYEVRLSVDLAARREQAGSVGIGKPDIARIIDGPFKARQRMLVYFVSELSGESQKWRAALIELGTI